MKLHTHRWGEEGADSVVCVHGVGQHGGIFEDLGQRLAAEGHSVLAVDLRGHGDSGREPPWDTGTHSADLLATLDSLGIERATWVGHSFGGRLCAGLAAAAPERTKALAMLDPGLEVGPAVALRSAEIERLDWSFATVDGAINALLSSEAVVASPHDVVRDYVEGDLQQGPDGRYRFRSSPSAAVVAWSEMVLPAPPIARVPTLFLTATISLVHVGGAREEYREALGDLLAEVMVPNGHNVLWESPKETISAVESFLATLDA
jgi:pimeloyl-ACP methyl ester carboxylesterase